MMINKLENEDHFHRIVLRLTLTCRTRPCFAGFSSRTMTFSRASCLVRDGTTRINVEKCISRARILLPFSLLSFGSCARKQVALFRTYSSESQTLFSCHFSPNILPESLQQPALILVFLSIQNHSQIS